MAVELPSGTVTFLFTDVEGSTRLLDELGAERFAEALGAHRTIVRAALVEHGGVEVDTQGDAFFCAFASARSAVECAGGIQERLAAGLIRVRIGVHTGEALVVEGHYVGMDVHRAARIGACGHGRQVVISPTTVVLLEPGEQVLRDLGAHRLKDLAAPIVLHQLGDEVFPPLKTLSRTNLPIPATPFLGRDDELRDLLERASEPGVRVLTLTGPGGTGKTRLGLQLAAEISSTYPDGVWWVPLASVREASLVASALARVLEIDEEPGRSLAASIVDGLARRKVLLLLDNCEHLVDEVADLVSAVVIGCSHAFVLATSREPLAVAAEQVVSVQPLVSQDAFELFHTRAKAAGANLDESGTRDAVTALCKRLDNLPLAVELAAARSVALPPSALLDRISSRLDVLKGPRDVDERQRTLRGTIGWSHDLLTDPERRLFRRLAIFVGGASLEAVEEVCEADLDELLSLVTKSLVRQASQEGAEPRYWMLETIREFAVAELDASGELETSRGAHLDWHADLARRARGRLVGRGSGEWLARLETDLENLRASLGCALVRAERDAATALASVLAPLHMLHGRYTEAEDVLLRVLALEPDPLEGASFQSLLGRVLHRLGRPEDALAAHLHAERLLESAPAQDEAWWETWIGVKLEQAHYYYFQNKQDELGGVIDELTPHVEARGTPVQNLEFLHVLAQDAYRRERYVLSDATEALAREIHRRSFELEDTYADFTLGFCLLWRDKFEEAESFFRRGIDTARSRGNALIEVRCLVYGVVAHRRRGDLEGAREALRELEMLDDLHGYVGLTSANASWIAYRDGNIDAASEHAHAALADWHAYERSGPTVFQWTARFPLLGVELARGEEQAAMAHARAMLDASQQPLPKELHALCEQAVATSDLSLLSRALEVAKPMGYA